MYMNHIKFNIFSSIYSPQMKMWYLSWFS